MFQTVLDYMMQSGVGVFGVLFVALLGYVLHTSNKREERYINTIDQLAERLGDMEDIKDTVERIEDRLT